MPKGYSHVTQDERCQIYTLLARDVPLKEIAELLKSIPQRLGEKSFEIGKSEVIDLNKLMKRRKLVVVQQAELQR